MTRTQPTPLVLPRTDVTSGWEHLPCTTITACVTWAQLYPILGSYLVEDRTWDCHDVYTGDFCRIERSA